MQNENHKILGVIFLCEFVITILFAILFLVLFGINFFLVALNANSNPEGFLGIFIVYAIIFLLYGVLLAGFGIAGWKLLKNKSGKKGWGVVASIFSIFFFFPIGLLISVLGFILLFADFGNNRNQNFNPQYPNNNPPQPPQNWR